MSLLISNKYSLSFYAMLSLLDPSCYIIFLLIPFLFLLSLFFDRHIYVHKTGLFREMWKCRGFGNKRKTRLAETHQYLYINWKASSTYLFLCLQEEKKKGIYLRSSAFGHDQWCKQKVEAVKPGCLHYSPGVLTGCPSSFHGQPWDRLCWESGS